MALARRQRKGKACENRTKENPWTGVRTSGETNTPPSWLDQFAQVRLRKEETRQSEASCLGLDRPHALRVYFPLLAE